MTVETYSYNGVAENAYAWTATGGSIQGTASGVGVLSVDVVWESTGTGTVSVVETDTTGCSGEVALQIDLLVNSISELELLGIQVYPNPANETIFVSMQSASMPWTTVELIDAFGRVVDAWQVVDRRMRLDAAQFANGLYTLRFTDTVGSACTAPLLIQH